MMSTYQYCGLNLSYLWSRLYLTMMATCLLLLCVMHTLHAVSSSATTTSSSPTNVVFWANNRKNFQLMCSVNNDTRVQYVAVIDAGSTGSRIHVYQFEKDLDHSFTFQVETYFEVSPGLSAYAFTPSMGANSIRSLIGVAKYAVPAEMRRQTPLVVKATAGLRLLPPKLAQNLLDEVYKVLLETDFFMPPDTVEIIDGLTEGLFGWLTVNYLIGAFNKQKQLAVSMDLGGGSSQLSLVPSLEETISSLPPEDLKTLYLFHSHYKVYTHSYLGLGLMSARFKMMGGIGDSADVKDRVLKSSCLPPRYKGVWKNGPVTYNIRGMAAIDTGFEDCYSSALQVLSETNIMVLPEMNEMPIYAFAYYFDIAVEAKLIDHYGGMLKISDYKNAALKECSSHGKHVFLCMDLTYIYTLLNNGFQLDDSTHIHVKHVENGAELSWTLGMAYHMLSSPCGINTNLMHNLSSYRSHQ